MLLFIYKALNSMLNSCSRLHHAVFNDSLSLKVSHLCSEFGRSAFSFSCSDHLELFTKCPKMNFLVTLGQFNFKIMNHLASVYPWCGGYVSCNRILYPYLTPWTPSSVQVFFCFCPYCNFSYCWLIFHYIKQFCTSFETTKPWLE